MFRQEGQGLIQQGFQIKDRIRIGVLNPFEIVLQPKVGKFWWETGESFYLVDGQAAISIPGNIFIFLKYFFGLSKFLNGGIGFPISKICKCQTYPAQSFLRL